MRLVKLTRFSTNQWGNWDIHGTLIWVNPEHITSILPVKSSVIRTEEESKMPVKSRPQVTYSIISLAVSLGQESETVYVCELPEQIFHLIATAENF